jgi:hypothetical protein
MKKNWRYIWHFTWLFLKYLALALIALIVLTIIILASIYRDLSGAAQAGLRGKTALTTALAQAQKQDWDEAAIDAEQARQEFTTALDILSRAHNKSAIKNISFINSQINDLEYLLKIGEILSRSAGQAIRPIQALNKISAAAPSHKFTDLTATDKGRFLKLIYESAPELHGLKANLDLAILDFDRIHRIGILWPIYNRLSDVKNELIQASTLIDKTTNIVKLLPALAGYPSNSRFLLIMQNTDELRPSGGFIGVYGIIEIQNGSIISFKADDSYHLDMPASTNNWDLEPPLPISHYMKVEKWYLRDANWSPDWPESARQIEKIYNGENLAINQPTPPFTGFIAITPDFVADLLKLVGPITVKDVTYDSNNFQPLLQYNVEIAYKEKNISSWDRKEIVNELMTELKNRLYNLPSSSWQEMLKVISNNITEKNIQLYFDNFDREALVKNLGAGGEVKENPSDYLLVVDANLAALKTDAVMKKNITYTVTETKNNLNAAVTLNYRHEGGVDWRTSRYRSYTRIYAPLGSQFISLNGLDRENADFTSSDDKNLGKTVFGFFWTVEPGAAHEITLNYRLPKTIKEQISTNNYQLLAQKQSGQRVEKLQVRINRLGKKVLEFSGDFTADKVFLLR